MRAARNERTAHAFLDTMPTDPELQRWIDATEASIAKREARKPRRRLSPVWRDLLVVVLLFAVAAIAAVLSR